MEEKEFEPHIPETLPIIPVKGGVIFPGMAIPFTVKEEKYQVLIDETLKAEKIFGAFLQKDENKKEIEPQDIYPTGTAVYIHRMIRVPDGTMRLFVQGIKRIKAVNFEKKEKGLFAKVEVLKDELPEDIKILEALKQSILSTIKEIIQAVPYIPEEAFLFLSSIEDYSIFTDMVASFIN